MNFAICDDIAADRETLLEMLRQYCAQRGIQAQISQFYSAGEFLRSFAPQKYHVIFLDIYMPGLSGIDAAKRIREQDAECMLVFTTTSEDHAMDSFSVYAAGYLLKPYGQARLEETLDWCVQNFSAQLQTYEFVSGRERKQIPLRDLVFVEIYGRDAVFHTVNQEYTVHRRLSEIDEELPEDFIRCHRSYIVNMNYIVKVESSDFLLKNGQKVPISPGMSANVKQSFFDWAYKRTWEVR